MDVVTNILNKHLGAVHNSSPLSIVQRKVMNLPLKNAEIEIHANIDLHVIAKNRFQSE